MQRKFVICDSDKCVGCKLCELACSATKEKSFNPLFSRIHTASIDRPRMSMSIACCLCEDYPCVKACPTKALSINEDKGVIQIDTDICVACGWCIASCEWGALALNPLKYTAFVCDLCDGDPECVKFCPKDALSFSTLDDAIKESRTENVRKLLEELFRSSRSGTQ